MQILGLTPCFNQVQGVKWTGLDFSHISKVLLHPSHEQPQTKDIDAKLQLLLRQKEAITTLPTQSSPRCPAERKNTHNHNRQSDNSTRKDELVRHAGNELLRCSRLSARTAAFLAFNFLFL